MLDLRQSRDVVGVTQGDEPSGAGQRDRVVEGAVPALASHATRHRFQAILRTIASKYPQDLAALIRRA